jgi:branched-chain amino acid transport system substrate-binding protein
MVTRNRLLAGASALTAALLMASVLSPARAQEPIKIGEVNSYKAFAAFLEPYKKGWEMAVEEVNAAGGVLGRKIEIVSRDDNGNPADAVRAAEELLSREKVAFLIGTFPSNVGLAVADFAKQRKMLFIAAEPLTDKIVWDAGNAFTFRLRTSTYMQTAMLIPDAAKLKKKRWAIVYPNYEYGTSATAAFKSLLKENSPTSSWRAGASARQDRCRRGGAGGGRPSPRQSSLLAPTLQSSAQGQQSADVQGHRSVQSLAASRVSRSLKDEAPVGWCVTAIPGTTSDAWHAKFLAAYEANTRTIHALARWSAIRR